MDEQLVEENQISGFLGQMKRESGEEVYGELLDWIKERWTS